MQHGVELIIESPLQEIREALKAILKALLQAIIKAILNTILKALIQALNINRLKTLKVLLIKRHICTMVCQGLTSMDLCTDLLQHLQRGRLRIRLFREQSSGNLLHRLKALDLRASTMKDDRWEHLIGKRLHRILRLPRVPTPRRSSMDLRCDQVLKGAA